jgi:hypothetical protein
MNQNFITPPFNSTLVVFADLVEEERIARKNYFAKCKAGRLEEKAEALNDLRSAERKVDEALHMIKNKPHADRRRITVNATGAYAHA